MIANMPLAAFDLETTGVDVTSDRIVTATIITIDGAQVHADEWLLDPGIDIPEGAAKVHGITTEKARAEGLPYEDGYRRIRDRLETVWAQGHAVVIMNAAYDLSLLHFEGLRLGLPDFVVGTVIDPLVIDKQIDKFRKGRRTLTALCDQYGVQQGTAHDATGDCLSAARSRTNCCAAPSSHRSATPPRSWARKRSGAQTSKRHCSSTSNAKATTTPPRQSTVNGPSGELRDRVDRVGRRNPGLRAVLPGLPVRRTVRDATRYHRSDGGAAILNLDYFLVEAQGSQDHRLSGYPYPGLVLLNSGLRISRPAIAADSLASASASMDVRARHELRARTATRHPFAPGQEHGLPLSCQNMQSCHDSSSGDSRQPPELLPMTSSASE